jgi:hypothetical protein
LNVARGSDPQGVAFFELELVGMDAQHIPLDTPATQLEIEAMKRPMDKGVLPYQYAVSSEKFVDTEVRFAVFGSPPKFDDVRSIH